MKKHEWVMACAIIVLMITGFLFHPLEVYYGLLRCVHSIAAVVLLIALIIHIKDKGVFVKKSVR